MTRAKKWSVGLCAFILAVALFLTLPLFAGLRSMAIMSVVSWDSRQSSLPSDSGLDISIPSGDGWYPFVISFNADRAFSHLTGQEDSKLTILYNFPAFDNIKGCSRLFDPDSDYYTAFYGAYLTQLPDGSAYGFFPDGPELPQAAAKLARLDLYGLVLSDFGLSPGEFVFEYAQEDREESLIVAGSGGWTRLQAKLRVNGAVHRARDGVMSYLQYGRPAFEAAEEFAPVDMSCLIYAKYFKEKNVSVFFYAMAPRPAVLAAWEKNILSGCEISFNG